LPVQKALMIAAQLAEGLAYAHERGVVHRDIKPANIMVVDSGEPKIMDFGIAKVPASQLTAAGHVFGTPANMSPEQARGVEVDGRSDLFSLGTVLYQLLTGRRAFTGESLPQILDQVQRSEPPPPSQLVAGIPAALDHVVARMLAKEPAARYQNGQAVAEDAEDVLAGLPPRHRASGVGERSESTLVSPLLDTASGRAPTLDLAAAAPAARTADAPETARRRSLAVAVLVALTLVGVAAGLRQWKQPPAPPPMARLIIDFEHPLRDGAFQLWLDDELVIDADLSGRVTKEILGLKLRKGTVEQILDVKPGSHRVRVRVAWDDNVKEERSRASIEPGATRQLEIRLGRLLKDLSLEWK
jgi:hypothetical protein